jgi:hypothetical protein
MLDLVINPSSGRMRLYLAPGYFSTETCQFVRKSSFIGESAGIRGYPPESPRIYPAPPCPEPDPGNGGEGAATESS